MEVAIPAGFCRRAHPSQPVRNCLHDRLELSSIFISTLVYYCHYYYTILLGLCVEYHGRADWFYLV